ncbi:MAG TPA: CoA ester lyase [Thermomicrobiales bacterium]|nr:CoA ester lyase [Thermomicrobiales bacterium]
MSAAPVSLLFVPGHRERMVAKAPVAEVDAVVFDLEDSVPPAEKDAARERVRAALADWPDDAPRPYVRVNPPRERVAEADAAVLVDLPGIGVVVPKIDRAIELDVLAAPLALEGRDVIVTIETPRSFFHLEEIADHWLVGGLCLGGEDLAFALGMARTPTAEEFTIPRFMLVAAARAGGIAAYDAICPEFRDLDILREDARRGAAAGMDGKFAIHPAQGPVIREAFRPSDEELERARRIVAEYDAAVARGEGAVAVDGQMIDPPVAERFRAILRRWEPAG